MIAICHFYVYNVAVDLTEAIIHKIVKEAIRMVKEILLLGNPKLYDRSAPVLYNELGLVNEIVDDMHDTLMDYRSKHGSGRAIAAPQIGVFKRIIYMHITEPVVFINPEMDLIGPALFELWDDCLSFPGLFVKVRRYKKSFIRYKDMDWNDYEMELSNDMSELLQHEFDHLNGILATMKAVDNKSLSMCKT